ncbi:SLATT domain-containing protein [Kovacikia minuta CCNUW1]|uniref:SLATT domain-containing protein n=1 Tax=Kovacikia minuta TaxID=2931930 RepID=UPI001CCE43BD|nr:SLATT domain-containing protein [Kovacikia minuta]UBF23983.1 SLATT domain-containing protein [Kovacikia minuta CCNUW1]
MSNLSNTDSYAKSLETRIWKTKGSRFNAARRLNRKYQFGITSIAILSVYGIAIPIIQSIPNIAKCQNVNSLYTAISTILSVFTLALSLLEGSKNHQLRAEKLHNNAVQISSLGRKLEYLITCESQSKDFGEKLRDLSGEYEKVVQECPENHEPEDYLLFQLQHNPLPSFKQS